MSRQARFASLGFALLLLLVVFAPLGCSKSSTAPKPGAASATVTGVVKDAVSGGVIAGASVQASTGGTATADVNGRFSVAIGVNQKVRIDVTHLGYSLNQLVVQLAGGQTSALNVSLLVAGTSAAVAPASGGKVTDAGSGATLTLPANFVTASGPVTVTVTGLDPTSAEVKALPGGLNALDAGGNPVYLRPVSFAEYTVKDAGGNVLQFNPSASSGADIELPIPASLQGKPGYGNGDPIECYVYDPADGKWKTPVPGVIGPSSVDGTPAIKATIFHLSWYGGAPASSEIGCVSGVVTLDGLPVAGVDVEAFPGDRTTTDASGHFQVPAGADGNVRVSASRFQSGEFRSAEGTVTVGAAGGPCGQLNLSLGAATAGAYTVFAELLHDTGADAAVAILQIGTGDTQIPLDSARVEVGTGGTWYPVPEIAAGYYETFTGQGAFGLTAGQLYTMHFDFDHNGSWDATSTVRVPGTAAITNPVADATVGATFTASWTDEATGVGGYVGNYLGEIFGGPSEATYGGLFGTSALSKVIGDGSGATTPFPNGPLPAGDFEFHLLPFNGPTFAGVVNGTGIVPNVTGTNVTGTLDAFSNNPIVAFHSTGGGAPLIARKPSAARAGEVREKIRRLEQQIREARQRAARSTRVAARQR